jgi:hypothetical protein
MRKQIAPIVLMALLGQSEATRLMNRRQLLAQTSVDPPGDETLAPKNPLTDEVNQVITPPTHTPTHTGVTTGTQPECTVPTPPKAGIAVGEPNPSTPDGPVPSEDPQVPEIDEPASPTPLSKRE